MLTVFLYWLVTAALTTAIGWATWRLAARAGLPGTADVMTFECLSLTGLATLTAILMVVSLFWPLNWAVQLIVGSAGLGLLVASRKSWSHYLMRSWEQRNVDSYWQAALLLVLGLWLVWRATNLTTAFDTGLYHLQTLQWVEQYPAVPGLGNLHGRLAFNSSLFLPMALLSYSSPQGPVYSLGSYFYVLLAVLVVRQTTAVLRHSNSKVDARWVWAPVLLLFALIYCFQVWLSSTYADCPLAMLLGFLFLRFARRWEQVGGQNLNADAVLLLLLALTAITIKLSAVPVLLLPAYIFWINRPALNRRWIVGLMSLSLSIIGPWLARNVVLSGYLVYPLSALDVFSVDWKVPDFYARIEHNTIANRARQAVQSPYIPFAEPLNQWLPHWWSFETPYSKAVLWLAAGAPLVAAWRWRQRPATETGWAIGWLVAWLGGLFWFLTAPDFRFGVGFLLVAAAWPWLEPRWLTWSTRWTYAPALVVLLYSLHHLRDPAYELRTNPATLLSRTIWPALPPVPPTVEVSIRGIVVRVPRTGVRCWGAKLPCALCVEADLEPRGPTFASGFRWHQQEL